MHGFSTWGRGASDKCEPFELEPVDFVLDELEEGCEFRTCAQIGGSVFDKTFLELPRSRKHDINLKKSAAQVSSSGEPGGIIYRSRPC